jgi:hypothetical protein
VGNLHFKKLLVGTYVFSALLGLAFAIFGLAPLLPVVLAGGFAFNLCLVASNTHWDSALQKLVPRNLLGRVTSVDYFGSFLVAPVAPVLAAAAIQHYGPSSIFLVGGLFTFVYWTVAIAIVRPDRTVT